jgi:hypothetical protein
VNAAAALTYAKIPVVVVRGRTVAADGPVVVGVDGSPSTGTALGLAFEAALARGTAVVAIRSHVPPAMPALLLNVIKATEREALEESLIGWREKYPTVEVEALLAVGRADRPVLIAHTRGSAALHPALRPESNTGDQSQRDLRPWRSAPGRSTVDYGRR